MVAQDTVLDLSLEKRRIFPEEGPARFNVAAWQKSNTDNVVLVAREVSEPGQNMVPDIGKLVLFEIDENNKVVHERTIWKPVHGEFYLEDPRARVGEDGVITIGLTAVLRADSGFLPFPAVVTLPQNHTWDGQLPPITLIHSVGPGKNITPIRKDLFLFRPEAEEYHHKLLIFNPFIFEKESSYDISFPTDLEWARWRIGTTMPPVWIDDDNALLVFHGINIENGKYIYGIGRARLYRDGDGKFKVKVAKDPIITPEMFKRDGKPMEVELHPELRRVVYACGGVVKRKEPDILTIYVNVADRATYEVKMRLDQLKSGLF